MSRNNPPTAILIAGPTASGKSAYALQLAKLHDGVIINTDSMQVYKQLHIVTARPSAADISCAPHYLYGHRDAAQPYSVAKWMEEVTETLQQTKGKLPIFVGGTGLYFKALSDGLTPVPELKTEVREYWRSFALEKGDELFEKLQAVDPLAAGKLRASDHQRLIRALEVFHSTGKSIVEWQNKDKGTPLLTAEGIEKILLMPERKQLHDCINTRFDKMVEMGALQEVEAMLRLEIDPTLPAMKAIGVPQFAAHLRGEISLEEAIEKAKAATRQYAKRQSTWFNNQFGDEWVQG